MSKKIFANVLTGMLLVMLLSVTQVRPAGAQGDKPPAPLGVDSSALGFRPVEVRLNPVSSDFRQAAPSPRRSVRSLLSASIIIDYQPNGGSNAFGDACITFPDAAKAAFDYAAGIWASQLNSSVPIHIDACWTSLGAGILGHGGPYTFYRDFSNAPLSGTWYPVALVNQYVGADLNGSTPEIVAAYNNDFLSNFYFGTDFATPGGQINFATVVLHEIAHGLGFTGFMSYSAGSGSWGSGGYPSSYDRFSVDGAGHQLINPAFYANPSLQLGSALTSGAVYFNGANARAANGSANVKLYAPTPWLPGSSYAHLDDSTFARNAQSIDDPFGFERRNQLRSRPGYHGHPHRYRLAVSAQ